MANVHRSVLKAKNMRRIVWPVLCALIGLALFYIFMVMDVSFAWHSNKVSELIITVIVTGIAAWAGGAAAFRAERTTREINLRNKQISAANRAIFKLDQLFNLYLNLKESMVDPSRNDEHRFRTMGSPQPGMLPLITFNFDELSFLLDRPGEGLKLLEELLVLEWKYQVLMITVDHRARFLEAYVRSQDNRAINALTASTNQMIENIDLVPAAAKKAYLLFCSVLTETFPGQAFLRIQHLENSGH